MLDENLLLKELLREWAMSTPQRYPALLADRQPPRLLANLVLLLPFMISSLFCTYYHLCKLVGAQLHCVDRSQPEQQPVLRGSVDGQDNAEDLAFVVVFVDAEQLEGYRWVIADF